jgi:UTP--glucose-1-phosphate uridylyltransferase
MDISGQMCYIVNIMIRRKAVVAAGGWGTRFGPPSISAEKCMALVDGKPVLQHVVEGLVDAGVEEIAIVVGAMSHQTRMHFGGNLKYEEYLHKKGKEALLEEARRIRSMADFCFIEQGDKQYGTSVPLAKAIGRGSRGMLQRFIKPGDSFLYLAGDQLFTPTEGRSEASIFVERLQRASIHAGMLAVEVPPEEVNKYGIVLRRKASRGHGRVHPQ